MKRMIAVLLLLTLFLSVFAFAQQEPQKAQTPPAGKMEKMKMMKKMRANPLAAMRYFGGIFAFFQSVISVSSFAC